MIEREEIEIVIEIVIEREEIEIEIVIEIVIGKR